MSKMTIDGEGTLENYVKKKNLSKRARQGKLFVEKTKCKFCNHHKIFTGNIMGQEINKCCKCNKYQK